MRESLRPASWICADSSFATISLLGSCHLLMEWRLTPRLGPWSTAESPGMALCSARSLSGALVASSSSAIVLDVVCLVCVST